MELVKLDSYDYILVDTYDDNDEYMYTTLTMLFDSPVDPDMHDILNELSNSEEVHVDGRYFKWKKHTLENRPPDGQAYHLALLLIEERKG